VTHALLYRAGSKWTPATAFAAAALIHISAVAFGSLHREIGAAMVPEPSEIDVVYPPAEEPSAAPNDPIPEPAAVPPDTEFVEALQPPRRIIKSHPTGPMRPPAPAGVPGGRGKPNTISAPRPEYPYEARRRHLTGSGVIVVSVDPSSGSVIDARVERSIGSPILDNSAVNAFKRWRFKPRSAPQVRIPVTFDLNGASY
jgi:protein TonB